MPEVFMVRLSSKHIAMLEDLPGMIINLIRAGRQWKRSEADEALVRDGDAAKIARLLHYSHYYRTRGCDAKTMRIFHTHLVQSLIDDPDIGMLKMKREDMRLVLNQAVQAIAERNYIVPVRLSNIIIQFFNRYEKAVQMNAQVC